MPPLNRPPEFGHVPRPDLVGPFGQEFGALVDGIGQLVALLAGPRILPQQLVHRADRGQVAADVQERCIDLAIQQSAKRDECS